MEVVVRFIKYNELNSLLDLYKHLHMDDSPVSMDLTTKLWDEIFNDQSLQYIVLEVDEQIVSSCTLAIIKNLTRGARTYGLIENVVTHTEHRNRGYGTKVLEKAVSVARDSGCYKVMLLTGSKKEETLRFYEKAGFERETKTGFICKL
ncbi:MAG: GNAT family N-acetyltransferase [Epulopiscium sp.]|nr:GNAT family N-acetyltransferase [Candidatus Epulonipiscium sp.]